MHIKKPPIDITLYDSYQKKLVTIQPDETVEQNTIKLYRCGPTVYFYQHIGNVAGAWLTDTIVNIARLGNWHVEHVENITDVGHLVGDGDDGQNVADSEDKMEKGAKRDGKTVQQIVDYYTDDYRAQCEALNIHLPRGKHNPKATEYIQEQMILALEMLKKGRAYLLEDGIYFDSEANQDLDTPFNLIFSGDNQFTGRDIKNITKNPADFALWKYVDEKSLQKWRFIDFETPLGLILDNDLRVIPHLWGCPGWHSECVAMICGILGKQAVSKSFSFSQFTSPKPVIDIHIGGEDHIDIHHRNEILQSEALGFHLSKYWVHNRFITVDSKKMSKSVGNVYSITGDPSKTGMESIVNKGFDPIAYRLMLFEHHSSQQIDFTWEKLNQSQNRLHNLRKECAKVSAYWRYMKDVGIDWEWNMEEWKTIKKSWRKILAENLNTPEFLHQFTKYLLETTNRIAQENMLSKNAYNVLFLYDHKILKLNLFPSIPDHVLKLGSERQSAKQDKNYKLADELRQTIIAEHWQIDDYPWGWGIWKK